MLASHSHVFEKVFLGRMGITDWRHEDMSEKMLQVCF